MGTTKTLAIGTVLKEQYRIQNIIGQGGMGAVYLAEDTTEPGRRWAIKETRNDNGDPQVLRDSLAQFENEARTLQNLHHPNLPQVGDFFEENKNPYLVMEYIDGETLERRLLRMRQPLEEQDVIAWMLQVCDVLAYLHNQNVIFRDIKPANIMLDTGGKIKLIDFGIARTYKVGKQKDTRFIGSLNYAPPEQYGKGQTDARSDIYATGATMAHLLTGRPPMPVHTPHSGALRKLNPSISEAVELIIIKAMQLDRINRYQTAHEMAQALRQVFRVTVGQERTALPRLAPSLPLSKAPSAASVDGVTGLVRSRMRENSPVAVAPGAYEAIAPRPAALPPSNVRVPCPGCGFGNRTVARFCARCGRPLAAAPCPVLHVHTMRGEQQVMIDKSPFVIGRRSTKDKIMPDLDLSKDDPKVYISRKHASITLADGIYFINDLGSANGVRINGKRIQASVAQPLRNRDRIQMGQVEIIFVIS